MEGLLADAGFGRVATRVVDHTELRLPAALALDGGLLGKDVVSQLSLLDQAAYDAGVARIRERIAIAEAAGEELTLDTDLRFFATTGWVL